MSGFDDFPRTLSMPRPRTLAQRCTALHVVAGPSAGLRHEFVGRARLGSRDLADLVLRDPKVSGLHCEIVAGDELVARDLGSKNGTFVGDVRIREAVLRPGQALTLGDSRVAVRAADRTVEIPLHPDDDYHGLIGCSGALRALTARLAQIAQSDATVLVLGETGTGKELVSEAIHRAGRRAGGPLVIVDCGALPRNLIEAELFGYDRGAFTGADAARAGAFERAHGGVLFLDEVGELPLELQPKLLRALAAREVRRIGGARNLAFDAQIVAATNRDLPLEVTRGRFREDLYHRLAVVVLTVPPLRERAEDIPLLAAHFLAELGVDPASVLTADALAEMCAYPWPGNVRELRNALERAATLSERVTLEPAQRATPPAAPTIDLKVTFRDGRQRAVDAFERAYLAALLAECRGNISEMARRARIDRMSIHRALQRLGLR